MAIGLNCSAALEWLNKTIMSAAMSIEWDSPSCVTVLKLHIGNVLQNNLHFSDVTGSLRSVSIIYSLKILASLAQKTLDLKIIK